ncbi:MAG TPA: type II secretion system protein [Phycisphaerae bacterium]|nr:type II secretion system protein [Phycisphaerae bacterium]
MTRRDNAFSLVESIISIVIVGGLLVAALTALGASRIGQFSISTQARATMLADGLMNEILQHAYEESSAGSLGLDAGEDTGDRSHFDDVDDYDGWASSPPQQADGTIIPESSHYSRSVTVNWVDPNNPLQLSISDSSVKLITVSVSHNGKTLATMSALRTRARQSMETGR